LTEKADVVEDMRKDVIANKELYQESEQKREELQLSLAESRQSIMEAAQEQLD